MVTFGEKLKQLRESGGMSQQDLADKSAVSVWAIRDYEQGKRRFDPGLNLLAKLSKALRVSMDVFAECAGEVPAKPAGKRKRKAEK
jgi:transcriptional regulator with XRE-family HTH domain